MEPKDDKKNVDEVEIAPKEEKKQPYTYVPVPWLFSPRRTTAYPESSISFLRSLLETNDDVEDYE
jgi:hypothetical protein